MKLPVTISNIHGEKLIFKGVVQNEKGIVLEVDNEVAPNAGPPMHVHWRQDESLTVVEGLMGYQVAGEEKKFAHPGENVTFLRGTAHKFWNAGDGILKCTGWINPPDNIVYFLSEIYRSTNENGGKPGAFDAAYLLSRYKSEFAMTEIPAFVCKYPIIRTSLN